MIWTAHAHAARDFIVGVLPYQGARALVVEHQKLAASLGQTLKRHVRVVTARNARVFGQRMLAGDYDLALAPAHLARLAQAEGGWVPLARYLPDTPAYLLAARDRAGEPLAKGAVIATPDRAMLLTLVAEGWIARHTRLKPSDYTVLETGGHNAAVQAVQQGRADAAVSMLAATRQVRQEHLDKVRIAHELGPVPLLVFMARGDIPPATRARLQRTLLAYPAPPPLHIAAVDPSALAAMNAYLPRTRELILTTGRPNAH
ncbi:MAG: phosphate/phosphite/phosphonate ABC transporter substrate-binding protein [Thiobacillus sp.]|nr:phosphate/phosphite/phosphonate ABC transporter substrate-binding protein [Thiobacillus sp.]